jgi:hypothetical protein
MQAGHQCIFEPRARPKSIATLSMRGPPFQPERPTTPVAPGFYPGNVQPAPPVTFRGEQYFDRREHMPRPSVLATPYAATRPHSPPPSTSYTTYAAPHQPDRLRNLEAAIRPLTLIPATLSSITSALIRLQESHDAIAARLAAVFPGHLRRPAARDTILDISEYVWDRYQGRAWPLTPWHAGLRERRGLSGFVVDCLGKMTMTARTEDQDGLGFRVEVEVATRAVYEEIGRLVTERLQWNKEEVKALAIFAYVCNVHANVRTWANDTSLIQLAIGQSRAIGMDKVRRGEDWRTWVHTVMTDQL